MFRRAIPDAVGQPEAVELGLGLGAVDAAGTVEYARRRDGAKDVHAGEPALAAEEELLGLVGGHAGEGHLGKVGGGDARVALADHGPDQVLVEGEGRRPERELVVVGANVDFAGEPGDDLRGVSLEHDLKGGKGIP